MNSGRPDGSCQARANRTARYPPPTSRAVPSTFPVCPIDGRMTKDRSEEKPAVLSTVIGALFERSGAGIRAQIGELLPAVPAGKVLGFDGAALERRRWRVWKRVTDWHDPDRGEVVGDAEG